MKRTLLPIALGAALITGSRTLTQENPKDFTNVKPADYGIDFVTPKKDPKTGFVTGGKNAADLIRALTEINGRTIADLETDMRPGAKSKVGSRLGFLGKDERLLDVLAEDNRYVVDQRGLTHQELAKHLHVLGAVGTKHKGEFLYHGKRFTVQVIGFRGIQHSPFYDDTKTNQEAVVHNVTSNKKLAYSLLVPHMIERYGFYEGKGTKFRVPPDRILEVLDFLKPKEVKTP